MADKRPPKTKIPETKLDLELPTSKGELVPYKKPEGGLSDTPQGKRARRKIRGSAKRRLAASLLDLLVGTAIIEEPSISASIEERMNPDPQRVYHGTTLPLESRESPEWYPKYGEEIQALGEWFTEDPQVASHFARGEEGTVYPSYLNIKRPKVYETYEDLEEDLYSSELGSEDFRKKLQEEGYDGIEITSADTDVLLGSGRSIERRDFVAFEPKQIISSISPNQEKSGLRLIQGGKKDIAKKGLSELGEEVSKKTENQKYNQALREQQKGGNLSQLENAVIEMGFTDLDEYMITDGEVMVNSIIERLDLIKNKTTQELVNDIEFMRDYIDWNTDYMRSGRSMGSGPTSEKKLNIENFFLKAAAELEKRMK